MSLVDAKVDEDDLSVSGDLAYYIGRYDESWQPRQGALVVRDETPWLHDIAGRARASKRRRDVMKLRHAPSTHGWRAGSPI